MTKPRLLDLFCCRGCASVGYSRAGFDIVGVDIDPTCAEFYPFELVVGDALAYVVAHGHEFDAIHASPPCQAYTTMGNRKRLEWPDLIGPTRNALVATGLPYVIENVPGARRTMQDTVTLRGGMFGLRVDRPRLFESNIDLGAAPRNERVRNPIGVYGTRPDGRRLWTRADGTEQRAASSIADAANAMGVDWPIDWTGLREAIPPAYTEWIGVKLAAATQEAVVA